MKNLKLISIVLCLLSTTGCKPKMIELQTDLPPAKVDRSQQPIQKSGEPLLVPVGTKLLSRGVEVTSSDGFPIIGNLEMITDGNKEVPDGYNYTVELMSGLQWVQLDLGKTHEIYAILVWHHYLAEAMEDYFNNTPEDSYLARVYQDVVIQISNDSSFKKDVTTVFNNDHDNSTGFGKGEDDTYIETSEGRWVNPEGVKGRYVRLYSRGHKLLENGSEPLGEKQRERQAASAVLNHYIEVEVYGL